MSKKPTYEELEQRVQILEKNAAEFEHIEDDFTQIQIELDALFNKAIVAMFIVDRDRRLCKVNHAALLMTRLTQDESIGIRAGEALGCVNSFNDPKGCGYSTACESCVIRNTIMDTFQSRQDYKSVEAPIPYLDGNVVADKWALVSTSLLKLPEGDRVFVCLEDITERKHAEEEKTELETRLRRAEKMEAIGTLAGGVAHEFNNILTIILGNTEMALYEISEWDPVKEYLKAIRHASMRAKEVVKNILRVARKSLLEKKPINISIVIKESLKLIRSTTPAMIEIQQNIECEGDMILGDVLEINKIIINLCDNAIRAIGNKAGILEVSLKPITLKKSSAHKYEDLKPGSYVKLMVRDSGKGINPKILNRIFDPYFTTGSLAERTGMGLAVTHGIVKKHEGAIKVTSEIGEGTAFEVLFPNLEQKEEQDKIIDSPNEKKRILFVDDEESVADITEQMLLKLGHDVETKTDSLEALEFFKSKPDHFNLVITDMGMPHMSGEQLAEELMKIRSDIPIILSTGYSDLIDEERAMELGLSGYLKKPIIIKELANSIRKVFEK